MIIWLLILIFGFFIGLSLMTNITYVEDTTLSSDDMDKIEDINEIDNIKEVEKVDNEEIVLDTESVTIKIDDNYNIDVFVTTNTVDVSVLNDENENTIKLKSDMIDEDMSSTAMVGLCVSGLDSRDSPTKISFENDNTIIADIDLTDTNTKPVHQGKSTESIIDKCTDL